MVRSTAATLALLALGAGCANAIGVADNTVVCRAYASHFSRVEVVAAGRVTRLLGSAPGIRSPHEGFLMRLDSPCGIVVRVESNQNFTGVIPLKIGDRINVKGEYEFYAQGGVIHWTHPDPTGHHPGGYVEVGKRVYQ